MVDTPNNGAADVVCDELNVLGPIERPVDAAMPWLSEDVDATDASMLIAGAPSPAEPGFSVGDDVVAVGRSRPGSGTLVTVNGTAVGVVGAIGALTVAGVGTVMPSALVATGGGKEYPEKGAVVPRKGGCMVAVAVVMPGMVNAREPDVGGALGAAMLANGFGIALALTAPNVNGDSATGLGAA